MTRSFRGDGTITITFSDSEDSVTIAYADAQLSADAPELTLADVSATEIREGTDDELKDWMYGRGDWNKFAGEIA